MFCPKCGAQLPGTAIFCKKCRYNIQKGKRTKKTVKNKKPKRKLKIILLLGIGGILLYFIGLYSGVSPIKQSVSTYTKHEIPSQADEASYSIGDKKGIRYSRTLAQGKEEGISIDYSIEQKILLPVLCSLLPGKEEQGVGIVRWKIKNNRPSAANLRVSVEIENWSHSSKKQILLKSGEIADIYQFPTFKDRLMENTKLSNATLVLQIEDLDDGRILFDETKTIKIAARGDIGLYTLGDERNKWIAAWVTPTDSKVLDVLELAKEDRWHGRISMCGYQRQQKDPAHVKRQMRGIFFALEKKGISYASITGSRVGQRVQLPHESLRQKTANCIDGAVLCASLFEAIGLEPVIVLVRGHAFVGVRTSPGSGQCYYLETTYAGIDDNKAPGLYSRAKKWIYSGGDDAFDRAIQAGDDNFRKYNKWQIIDIKECRDLGIKPMQ